MLTGRYRYKKNWFGKLVVQVEQVIRDPKRRIPIGQHSVTVYRNATLDDLKLIGLADHGTTKPTQPVDYRNRYLRIIAGTKT